MILGALGERESGTERLEQAVDAFRAALEERTRERVPESSAPCSDRLASQWRRRARTALPGSAGCDYCSEGYLDEE